MNEQNGSTFFGDLDSPTWYPSIIDDDNARFLMGTKPCEVDNDLDCENNDRKTDVRLHDPVYKAILKDLKSRDIPTGLLISPEEEEIEIFKSKNQIENMEVCSDPSSPEEVLEETIVPRVVTSDKGAFITKMDGGGVEFIEQFLSPEMDHAIDSTSSDHRSKPAILHVARAVATPTMINVGDCSRNGKYDDTREPQPKNLPEPNSHTECPKSNVTSTAETQTSIKTPPTADSGIHPSSGQVNPWEFPSGIHGLNPRPAPRQSSSQSSGIMSMSSSSSSGSEMSPKDVMISYSHTDREMMKKIKARLEDAGITVWVDSTGLRSGVDFLSKIGQAIIDAKLFVSLVSPKSLQSKFCRDELSLAYISDKFLFPVALHSLDKLAPVMDTGLKLVLTRLEWTLLHEERNFDIRMDDLVMRMKKRIEQNNEERSIDTLSVRGPIVSIHPATTSSASSSVNRRESYQAQAKSRRSGKRRHALNRQHSMYPPTATPRLDSSDSSSRESLGVYSISLTPSLEENTAVLFFWQRNFDDATSVPWSRFEGEFRRQYGDELDRAYDKEDQKWMLEILYKELVDDEEGEANDNSKSSVHERGNVNSATAKMGEKLVHKSKYEDYCKLDGEMHTFWSRLRDQAVEKLAMKAVFGMESEPAYRLKAVENLSKFKSVAVMEALVELLDDEDPNVRAIAAISVAKCGSDVAELRSRCEGDSQSSFEDVDELLLKLLQDRDRLVRESVCIAFGHRKNRKVVPNLLHTWRNDNISSVREAAQLALSRIGGEEADRAIQMTTILQEEMKTLMNLYG